MAGAGVRSVVVAEVGSAALIKTLSQQEYEIESPAARGWARGGAATDDGFEGGGRSPSQSQMPAGGRRIGAGRIAKLACDHIEQGCN